MNEQDKQLSDLARGRAYPPRSVANPNAPQRDMTHANEVLRQNRLDAIQAKRLAQSEGKLPAFVDPE